MENEDNIEFLNEITMEMQIDEEISVKWTRTSVREDQANVVDFKDHFNIFNESQCQSEFISLNNVDTMKSSVNFNWNISELGDAHEQNENQHINIQTIVPLQEIDIYDLCSQQKTVMKGPQLSHQSISLQKSDECCPGFNEFLYDRETVAKNLFDDCSEFCVEAFSHTDNDARDVSSMEASNATDGTAERLIIEEESETITLTDTQMAIEDHSTEHQSVEWPSTVESEIDVNEPLDESLSATPMNTSMISTDPVNHPIHEDIELDFQEIYPSTTLSPLPRSPSIDKETLHSDDNLEIHPSMRKDDDDDIPSFSIEKNQNESNVDNQSNNEESVSVCPRRSSTSLDRCQSISPRDESSTLGVDTIFSVQSRRVSMNDTYKSNLQQIIDEQNEKLQLQETQFRDAQHTIETLQLQLQQEKEDMALSKTQCRTLAQRIVQLEDDLCKYQQQSQQTLDNLNRSHSEAMTGLEQRLTNEKMLAINALREVNDSNMLRASNRIASLESAATELKMQMTKREQEMNDQLQDSIRLTKQQVYEKVKSQFDEGNAQYQRLRGQHKVTEENLSAALRQVEDRDRQISQLNQSGQAVVAANQLLTEMIKDIGNVLGITFPSTQGIASATLTVPMVAAIRPLFMKGLQDRMMQINEMCSQRDSFKTIIGTLEASLANRDLNMSAAMAETKTLTDKLAVTDALLTTVRMDLNSVKKDYQSVSDQLIVSKKVQEEAKNRVDALEKTKVDLENRCLRLRKMNEELVTMLEARVLQEQLQRKESAPPS